MFLHLNCGLHDVKTVSPRSRELVVPPDVYRRNLAILLGELRFFLPDATLIFAATTPIIETATTDASRAFSRFNRDIEAANAIAIEVAASYNVQINDLWREVQGRGPQTMINADGVHYDEAGSRILGEAVAQKIREVW